MRYYFPAAIYVSFAPIRHNGNTHFLQIGSVALPELMAATVAQLSQKTRTVVPVSTGSQSLVATSRFQHSRLETESLEEIRVVVLVML